MMRAISLGLFAAVLLIMLSFSVTAAEEPSADESSPVSTNNEDRGAGYLPYSEPSAFRSGGMAGAVARTIFSLAVVIGLLYVFLWGLKKISAGAAVTEQSESIRVVGRIYLNPKTVIHFVRLIDELIVVGTSSGNIALLTTIQDERRIEQLEAALKSGRSHASGVLFSKFFDKSLLRFQKHSQKDDLAFDDQLKAVDDQIGRLKGLARKRHRDE